jgi:restriction system-associated AAA family ATPase
VRLTRIRFDRVSGGATLLNGLDLELRRSSEADTTKFQPLCVIGPNGSGKSQFLQCIAEFLQAALHAAVPREERREVDPRSAFTIRYVVQRDAPSSPLEVELIGEPSTGSDRPISLRTREAGDDWSNPMPVDAGSAWLLPTRIVAYTSGENETLSLPFLASRIAYADEIQRRAIPSSGRKETAWSAAEPGTPRLMLIDYGTHLEVLVANLLLGSPEQRRYLLDLVGLDDLRSVKCIVSLNHRAVKNSIKRRPESKRRGVQLTDELEGYIDTLKACATTWDYDEKDERYEFDFWIDEEARGAFARRFSSPFDLYLTLHKLALLNDLAISNLARRRFEADVENRRFASRLPEPPEEDKVFRFEEITFHNKGDAGDGAGPPVDYVSLSDGEHQLVQILGVFAMVNEPNVLFLLDEPESHMNPQWRVEFMSKLAKLPTSAGARADRGTAVAAQEVLITTHAPFVPSDLPREQVLVFRRSEGTAHPDGPGVRPRRPDIQTFGASYEEILAQCFDVSPPISRQPLDFIEELKESSDAAEVEAGLRTLGPSVEKVLVADHLDELKRS